MTAAPRSPAGPGSRGLKWVVFSPMSWGDGALSARVSGITCAVFSKGSLRGLLHTTEAVF